ncbi:hypothetical protein N7475_002345 [Penicillium sp. IBT 31633x]|nr:hypothetical protein N7475_002345 [Penicillium sp. IBT 31633x]
MDQKPFSPAPGVFPISLLKTIGLISILIYLQILYAVSNLARPFRNSRREFPPFNKAIVRAETSITNAVLGAVQLSAFSSATGTERPWHLSSGNGLLNQDTNLHAGPTIANLPGASTWPPQAQRYSDSSEEQESSNPRFQSNNLTPLAGPVNPRQSSSVYETLRKLRSSTQDSMSTIASSAKAIFHQPLGMVARNLDGSPPDVQRSDTISHQPKLKLAVVPAPVPTPEPRFVENVPFPVPMSAPARMGDHFSDPGPEYSLNLRQPVLFGATIDAAVDAETVQMNRSRKYHSIESYPGKFPVSDALDYSSLATAYAVRGRGTTSVRPFSDY